MAIVKFALKFAAGVNVTPASSAFTSAFAPAAVHTPVPALYVEVTDPEVPVLRLPAAVFDSVSVTVTFALSTSATTMSVRFSAVSSVYVSPALRFVAVGASFTATTVIVVLAVLLDNPVSSRTTVVIVRVPVLGVSLELLKRTDAIAVW